MIPELGHFALILALVLSLVQAVVPLIGARRNSMALMAVGRPAAQAVDVGDVGTAHVGQQGRDGGLLGRDGDVDGASLHQVNVGAALDQHHCLLGTHLLGEQG